VPCLLQRLEQLDFHVECLLPNGRILINVGEGPGIVVCVHDAPPPATGAVMNRIVDQLSPLFGGRGFTAQFEKAPSADGDLSRLLQAVRLWLSTPEANGTERAFYEADDLSLHLFRRPDEVTTRVVVPELDMELRLASLRREWMARPSERMPELWLVGGRMAGRTGGAAWLQRLYGMAALVQSLPSGQRLDRYAPERTGLWVGPESAPVSAVLRWQGASAKADAGHLVQYDNPRRTQDTMELAIGHVRYTHLLEEEDGQSGPAMGWLTSAPGDKGRV
jgi:hypothetical protein